MARFVLGWAPMLPPARILVADDDPALLDAVCQALQGLGAEVVRAESGAELIVRMAGEGPFGLVVTDLSMPWMSGLEAMRSLRGAGFRPPVILMTARRDEWIPAEVQALGRNAVLLRKPFELSQLEAEAARLLAPLLPPHPVLPG